MDETSNEAEQAPTAVCPGGTCGDEKTARRIPDSTIWVCSKCGRSWNNHEISKSAE